VGVVVFPDRSTLILAHLFALAWLLLLMADSQHLMGHEMREVGEEGVSC